MSWEDFAASITEAQKLTQPEDFDFLHRIGEGYATLRRYALELLDVLGLHAAPAAKPVLEAINQLREITPAVANCPAMLQWISSSNAGPGCSRSRSHRRTATKAHTQRNQNHPRSAQIGRNPRR